MCALLPMCAAAVRCVMRQPQLAWRLQKAEVQQRAGGSGLSA